MGKVTVEIDYKGLLAQKSGIASEKIGIERELCAGRQEIQNHLKNRHGIVPPYVMLKDGQSLTTLAKKQKELFAESDRVTVMEAVSGG